MFLFHPQSLVRREDDQYHVSLFTSDDQDIKQILLRAEPDHEETWFELKKSHRHGQWQCWKTRFLVSAHSDLTLYCFKVLLDGRQVYLHAGGESPRLPQKHHHFRLNSKHQPPAWVKEQVFYQIFPERFANGDPSTNLDPAKYEYNRAGKKIITKQWGEPVAESHGSTGATEFYGGDLPGITQNLDYLQDLGVTGLYLNPIFTSPSNHKYDTIDYFEVDPHFGGDQALIELRQHTQQRGMKLMLDAVVNHTSSQHPWFDRYGQHQDGAYQSADSSYRSHYTFLDEKNYWAWKGVQTLPKLDFSCPQVQRYVYAGEDSILKHWLKEPFNIDAWRFDVIHMLGETTSAQNNAHYVKEFRRAIKDTNPEAYMIGEHFSEATQWLQGEQEDGAMNYYGFANPVTSFLLGIDVPRSHPINIDAEAMASWLRESAGSIPFANQLAQYNMLDSHDTPRFQFLAKEDKASCKLAATLLLSYPGVPSIYYGDEIGMTGDNDPDCRRCFPWDETLWDVELRQHYQKLIATRKAHAPLQAGDLISLYAEGDVWVFARWLEQEHCIVAINRGGEAKLEISLDKLGKAAASYVDQLGVNTLSANKAGLVLDIAAKSSGLFVAERA